MSVLTDVPRTILKTIYPALREGRAPTAEECRAIRTLCDATLGTLEEFAVPASACPYHPEGTDGSVGMHHCPECSEMVVAGLAHPNFDATDGHLADLARIRFGDLVLLDDGYYALVTDPLADNNAGTVDLFQGNGLSVSPEWTKVRKVLKLPGSEAHVNFAEFMVVGRT